MDSGSKKLTLEERLSLAAKKGKRRNRKQRSVSPAPSPPSAGSVNLGDFEKKDSEATEPIVGSNGIIAEDHTPKKKPQTTDINTDDSNLINSKNEDEDYLVAITKDAPWSSWLPAEIRTLSPVGLLRVLEPHIREIVKQNEQSPKADLSSSALVKVIKEKEDIIVQLRQEGEKLSKTELRQSSTIKNLKKQVVELEEEGSILQEELSKNLEEHEGLVLSHEKGRNRLLDLENKLKQLTEEKEDSEVLKARLVERDAKLNKLEELLETKKNEIEQITSNFQLENESLKSTTRDQITLLESNLEQLRIELESCNQSSKDKGEGSNIDWLEQCKVLRKELQHNKSNWSVIEDTLNNKISKLENQLEESQRARLQLNEKLDTALQSNENLHGRVLEATNASHSTQHLIEQLRTENASLKASLEDINDDFRLLQKKFNIQKAHLERNIDSSEKMEPKEKLTSPMVQSEPQVEESKIEDEWLLPSIISTIEQAGPSIDLKDKLSGVEFGSEKSNTELEKGGLPIDISDIPNEAAELGSMVQGDISRQYTSSTNIQRYNSEMPASNQMNAQMVSKLGAEIRRFEVELSSLRNQCDRAQKEKNAANDEILRLLEENENLKKSTLEKNELQKQVDELQSRLETSLQLLGEKTERAEELENDVEDLKDMMKQQIQDMMALQEKSNQL